MKTAPFFGYLAGFLQAVEDRGVATMAVNYRGVLRYNPEFVMSLSEGELKGIIAHEVLHLALRHLARRGGRDPLVWGLAADAVANYYVEEVAGLELPDGVFRLPGDYVKDRSVEQVYDDLAGKVIIEVVEGAVVVDGRRYRQVDEHEYGEEGSPEVERAAAEWRDRAAQALYFARQRGSVPGELERLVEGELHGGRVDWRRYLRERVAGVVPTDYTYLKPSRRSQALGLDVPLPSAKRETVEVVAALDVSGSISDEEYLEFLGELKAIAEDYPDAKMTVITCDCAIKRVVDSEFDPRSLVEELRRRIGYGGTSHKPVFEWVKENRPGCRLLICFTDLHTECPEEPPPFDVLWVATRDHGPEPPFGTVVVLD